MKHHISSFEIHSEKHCIKRGVKDKRHQL